MQRWRRGLSGSEKFWGDRRAAGPGSNSSSCSSKIEGPGKGVSRNFFFSFREKKDIILNTMDKVRIKRKEFTFKGSGIRMALELATATLEARKP